MRVALCVFAEMSGVYKCPVCGNTLEKTENGMKCPLSHSFDMSREGYVNLLTFSRRSGDSRGDSKEMSRSRRDFLDKGYYSVLAEKLASIIPLYCGRQSRVLDICCGEGYYTAFLASRLKDIEFYGFDISKEMVRLASLRRSKARFFVANLASNPVNDGSFDLATHLFAPFNEKEFCRVLKKGGHLISVTPGKDHLMGLKKVLYELPYPNDEKTPDVNELTVKDVFRVKTEILLENNGDIMSLFRMTPYYFRTPESGRKRLASLETLKTEIEFIITVYEK